MKLPEIKYYIFPILLLSVFATVFVRDDSIYNGFTNAWYFYFTFIAAIIIIVISVYLIIRNSKTYTGEEKRLKLSFNLIDAFVMLFLAYSFVRLLFTPNELLSNKQFLILLFLTALYFIWKEIIKKGLERKNNSGHTDELTISYPVLIIISAFLISGLIESLMGILQLYNFLPGYVNSFFKVNGTFVNPDNFSDYLAAVLPFSFCIYKFLPSANKAGHMQKQQALTSCWKISFLKYLSLITFLASLFILPVLKERASIVACAVAIIFIFFYDAKVRDKVKLFTDTLLKKVVIILSIIILVFIAAKALYNIRPVSIEGRLLIWKVTGNIIRDHPIFGSGFDRFSTDYDIYQANNFTDNSAAQREMRLASNVKHADNEYLQVAADLGVIGFILFIGIIISVFAWNRKNNLAIEKKNISQILSISAKASLISVLIVALFSSPFRILPAYINFMFLLSLTSASFLPTVSADKLGKIYQFKPRWFTAIILLPVVVVLSAFILFNNYKLFNTYKTWKTGAELASVGYYKGAIDEFRQAYGKLNDNGGFLFNYGGTLTLDSQYKKAASLLEKSKMNFTDPKQYVNLGICYENLNKFDTAESSYEYASNIIPSLFYPKYLLAKLLVKENKKDGAELLCREILNSKAKVKSTAVSQMKEKIKTLLTSLNKPVLNGNN